MGEGIGVFGVLGIENVELRALERQVLKVRGSDQGLGFRAAGFVESFSRKSICFCYIQHGCPEAINRSCMEALRLHVSFKAGTVLGSTL